MKELNTEIDCYFVCENVMLGDIVVNLINSNDQLSNIFTKFPQGTRVDYICYKLGAHDLLAPT